MRKDITADSTDCKITRSYNEKFYAHKFDSLEIEDMFLERPTTKVHSRITTNPEYLYTIKEFEFSVKNLPTKKIPRHRWLH